MLDLYTEHISVSISCFFFFFLSHEFCLLKGTQVKKEFWSFSANWLLSHVHLDVLISILYSPAIIFIVFILVHPQAPAVLINSRVAPCLLPIKGGLPICDVCLMPGEWVHLHVQRGVKTSSIFQKE